MRIVYFTHSLVSCWNHGNAHFQRGVLRALQDQGHDVVAYEAETNWSRHNLAADQGEAAVQAFAHHFPTLQSHARTLPDDLAHCVDGADLVIVHEWNEPVLIEQIGLLKRRGHFTLLFHDTHHRAVSDPESIRWFELSDYDGVLAFGATLARVYERWGWRRRVFIWHEAADTALFHPPARQTERHGAVWVGNWGDGERTSEIESFLLAPALKADIPLDIHGVRYPPEALALLKRYEARFHGWIANARVPEIFARRCFTVHVPRRAYTTLLPGIPTIRVFEALACGIPLVTAPWDDCERLFRPGDDYLVARSGLEMQTHMTALAYDHALAAAVAASGLARIRAHHSCAIRAAELLGIVETLRARAVAA